jgi:hypothetical protein
MAFPNKLLAAMCCLLLPSTALVSQQSSSTPNHPSSSSNADSADFLRTTDEVLAEMSKILGLPLREPLKKSLRSREEIRAYVIREMKEDETPEERYADQKEMQKLGLIPKDFPLDTYIVDLLSEQIAGLYDSKSKEFYIADWIPAEDQREVMAHELTHALQDQYFHLDSWRDAAKPNEDAELARDAVLEGSATAAMLDYGLHQQGMSLASLGDLDLSGMLGDLDDSPLMAKAPPFLRDDLTFPYVAGADFAQHVLLLRGGWSGIHTLFENPPVSTQQILHPDLYLNHVRPEAVDLPDLTAKLGPGWKKLDANVLGEFGVLEVLKQFLGEQRAKPLAAVWDGDRFAIYEQGAVPSPTTHSGEQAQQQSSRNTTETSPRLALAIRVHTANDVDAARLFAGLAAAYQTKYDARTKVVRRPNFLSFDTPDGPVFLRCFGSDCLSLEGSGREVFDEMSQAVGWPAEGQIQASDGSREGSSNKPVVATQGKLAAASNRTVCSLHR